jgi:hypothetical protein
MTSAPDLHAELCATRRELQAARRALQQHASQRVAHGRPITREDTVRALNAVLQHTTPRALDELRAERDRLARDLMSSQIQLRLVRGKYSQLRYMAWQSAQGSLSGGDPPEVALRQICEETEDSEDDRAWEGQWRE